MSSCTCNKEVFNHLQGLNPKQHLQNKRKKGQSADCRKKKKRESRETLNIFVLFV